MAERWIKRIKKDLVDNGASTAAQVAARFGRETRQTQRALWRLTTGASPHVSASGDLAADATTYTWID